MFVYIVTKGKKYLVHITFWFTYTYEYMSPQVHAESSGTKCSLILTHWCELPYLAFLPVMKIKPTKPTIRMIVSLGCVDKLIGGYLSKLTLSVISFPQKVILFGDNFWHSLWLIMENYNVIPKTKLIKNISHKNSLKLLNQEKIKASFEILTQSWKYYHAFQTVYFCFT